MIFHENRLLAGNSHEKAYLIFFRKLGKMSQNLSSAAVVIGTFRVNRLCVCRYSMNVRASYLEKPKKRNLEALLNHQVKSQL